MRVGRKERICLRCGGSARSWQEGWGWECGCGVIWGMHKEGKVWLYHDGNWHGVPEGVLLVMESRE